MNINKTNKRVWLAISLLTATVLILAYAHFELSQRIDLLHASAALKPSIAPSESEDRKQQARRIATVEDLDRMRSLVDKGAYEEALEEHIWFHEVSRFSPSLAGVRASFALSNWADLGKRFPPAMEALISLKDQYRDSALSGKGDFNEVGDLFAILRTLDDEAAIIEDFKILAEVDPENAGFVYRLIEEYLVKNQELELINQYMGDPILKYEEIRMMRESRLSYSNNEPSPEKASY
jgi:hypothetical protein